MVFVRNFIRFSSNFNLESVIYSEKKTLFVHHMLVKPPSSWLSLLVSFGGKWTCLFTQALIETYHSAMFMTWRNSWAHLFNDDPGVS